MSPETPCSAVRQAATTGSHLQQSGRSVLSVQAGQQDTAGRQRLTANGPTLSSPTKAGTACSRQGTAAGTAEMCCSSWAAWTLLRSWSAVSAWTTVATLCNHLQHTCDLPALVLSMVEL